MVAFSVFAQGLTITALLRSLGQIHDATSASEAVKLKHEACQVDQSSRGDYCPPSIRVDIALQMASAATVVTH